MTDSSPGMCIDRGANPHSFASPSYSCWTSPSAPWDQTSVSRLRRARSKSSTNAAFFDVPQYALQTSNSSKCNKHIKCFFSNACRTRARAPRACGDADYEEGLTAHVVSHHSNSDGISPRLTLMSPFIFHKMYTFLHVTSTCHCLVMMTYTNIQRIAFLFHDFSHTKLIPKPPGLLLMLPLHHHYTTPPRIREHR